jgi:hypothetical protein
VERGESRERRGGFARRTNGEQPQKERREKPLALQSKHERRVERLQLQLKSKQPAQKMRERQRQQKR